ncbi:MAG: SNF2-related protein [Myxococcaceae bacterium]
MRRRRSDEERRFVAPQRSGHIDANPHQIEAVIFALSRLGDGGCILADEVGLGKTIEAGLVIAQLRAEGAQRILLITPKALLGQWRQELYTLFGLDAREADDTALSSGAGIFILGREGAGSERGQQSLRAAPPFDLIVIDEAHEIFGGLYRRYDSAGLYRDSAKVARTAARVFEFIQESQAPVLLLTATPIQNSLAELWSLVRFVDRSGTLLGDLPTFRQTFCDSDDRQLQPGQAPELKRRISQVLRRTLRRQAQEFLSKPFVAREAQLFRYPMGPDERALYEDVTTYLLSPSLAAFRGKQRRLLLIGFHRRMASSTRALASSLEKVAERLARMAEGKNVDDALVREFEADLEESDLADLAAETDPLATGAGEVPTAEEIRGELTLVQSFVSRATGIKIDGKSKALLDATKLILGRKGSSGRVVIFTESLVTQEHLAELLVSEGLVERHEVTVFRGLNDSPESKVALERWNTEIGAKLELAQRPSREIAMRLALVHEFKTRSKVFISTEAGAKGLNLQFCDTVINYDLPWNPQRIEQRIGRCHRYGQENAVTVINFLAEGNETEQLTFEILSEKLELFGTVLDASDVVLHHASNESPATLATALGSDLESRLSRIWERARTQKEVAAEIRDLRDQVGEARRRFDEEQEKTAGLIDSYFDDEVKKVFSKRRAEVPIALSAFDDDLERLVANYLRFTGASFQRSVSGSDRLLVVSPDARLPADLGNGFTVSVGPSNEHDALHLSHPLVVAAIASARAEPVRKTPIAIQLPADAPMELLDRRGSLGRLVGLLARYEGLEKIDRLIPVVLCEGEEDRLSTTLAAMLVGYPMRDLAEPIRANVQEAVISDAVEEAGFDEGRELSSSEQSRFERSLEQLEHYVDDQLRLVRRQHADVESRLDAMRTKRDATMSADIRAEAETQVLRLEEQVAELDEMAERLVRRENETYQRCRGQLHARRFKPTQLVRLFDVEFLLE